MNIVMRFHLIHRLRSSVKHNAQAGVLLFAGPVIQVECLVAKAVPTVLATFSDTVFDNFHKVTNGDLFCVHTSS